MKNRVVVTGIGAVTPLGNNAKAFWEGLLTGKSGVDYITAFDTEGYSTKFAAEVKDFNPEDYMDKKRHQAYGSFRAICDRCGKNGRGRRRA